MDSAVVRMPRAILQMFLLVLLLAAASVSSLADLQPPNHPIPDSSILPSSNTVTMGAFTIELYYPEDGYETYPVYQEFRYYLTNTTPVDSCVLMIDNVTCNQSASVNMGLNRVFCALPDSPGTKGWKVLCTKDMTTNQSSLHSIVLKEAPVVPLPVQVEAVAPADHAAVPPGRVTFTYNLTNTTLIDKCELRVNGIKVNTTAPKPGVQDITTYIAHEYTGLYTWQVTCFNGTRSNATTLRTVNVTTEVKAADTALVQTNKNSYYPGETIQVNGSLFDTSAQISLLFRRNGLVLERISFYATIGGTFAKNYTTPFNISLGNYSFYAENKDNTSQNGSADFSIALPECNITFANSTVAPGEQVQVDGSGFLPGQEVRVKITDGNGQLKDTWTLNATTSGAFKEYYSVPAGISDTVMTFFAYTLVNEMVNATGNLTIKNPQPPQTSPPPSEEQPPLTSPPPSGTPPANTIPISEPPMNDDYDEGYIDLRDDEVDGGSSMLWILIVIGVVVLLVGGFVGFLAYEGNLDLSSFSGFMDGVKQAFGGSSSVGPLGSPGSLDLPSLSMPGRPAGIGKPLDENDARTLTTFINSERSKGYDDLTIRNALLKKGWTESEVDGVFDQLYNS